MMAALLLVALAQSPRDLERVAWVSNPRVATATWVSDAGNRLSPAARDSINRIIGTLERETTAEIAVVIVDSLSGMAEQVFALAVHRAWGVGKAGKDNGVVLLWAPNDRATFVSVGTGLEGVMPDRRTGRLLDEFLIPAFREQRWDDGMIATVAALATAVREETSPRAGLVRGTPSVSVNAPDRDGGGLPGPLVGILGGLGVIGAGIGGGVGYRRWKRKRPRPCPKCGTMMRRLDEQKDDDHLEQGAKAEERIGSIDWDVWECPSCGETLEIPYKQFFSRFSDCPQCKRHTVESGAAVTLVAATTSSSGTSQTKHICKHCGHAWTTTATIARISTSSGSSSSGTGFSSGGGGGSSFGGGSAGGGGAGRKY